MPSPTGFARSSSRGTDSHEGRERAGRGPVGERGIGRLVLRRPPRPPCRDGRPVRGTGRRGRHGLAVDRQGRHGRRRVPPGQCRVRDGAEAGCGGRQGVSPVQRAGGPARARRRDAGCAERRRAASDHHQDDRAGDRRGAGGHGPAGPAGRRRGRAAAGLLAARDHRGAGLCGDRGRLCGQRPAARRARGGLCGQGRHDDDLHRHARGRQRGPAADGRHADGGFTARLVAGCAEHAVAASGAARQGCADRGHGRGEPVQRPGRGLALLDRLRDLSAARRHHLLSGAARLDLPLPDRLHRQLREASRTRPFTPGWWSGRSRPAAASPGACRWPEPVTAGRSWPASMATAPRWRAATTFFRGSAA